MLFHKHAAGSGSSKVSLGREGCFKGVQGVCCSQVYKGEAYIDRLVLVQCNVEAIEGQCHRVQSCPALAAAMFVAGGDTEPNRGVVTARHHGVVAGALEVVELPIKGAVMRVTVDVADGTAGWVTAPLAVLDLADLVLATGQGRANHVAIGFTPALASAVLIHRGFAFLQAGKHQTSV